MKSDETHRPHRDHAHHTGGEAAQKPAEQGEATPGGPAPLPEEQPAPAPAKAEIESQHAAKTKECKDLLDQLQRLAAEYANYQKRMERTLQDECRMGIRSLVVDLLPVMDNFERALEHVQDEASKDALAAGLKAVYEQFLAALKKHGVTPFESQGQTFDPEHHEAILMVSSDEHAEGKIAQVMQKGYRLNGQTIRPSRVAVSGGPAKPPEEEK
ncbi:MAG: nucleotide exchange factor GrpE, partial [Planctomycetota bacterium]|nr:nucleotide exchange factor GrpE [Planctomycetota bacterium]